MDNELNKLPVNAIILAAGKGTRMKSNLPKVLHPFHDKPLVLHVYDSLRETSINNITFVVGYKHEFVRQTIKDYTGVSKVNFAVQDPQNGTGHAVLVAKDKIPDEDCWILVALGDVPFLQARTVVAALEFAESKELDGLVITIERDDPTGYGRILRDKDGNLIGIREQTDATQEERSIKEVNTGTFIFRSSKLFKYLEKINQNNAQSELYLTDIVELFCEAKLKMNAYKCSRQLEFEGVNSEEELLNLEKISAKVVSL